MIRNLCHITIVNRLGSRRRRVGIPRGVSKNWQETAAPLNLTSRRRIRQSNASPRTDKTSPIEMADFVYPEFSKHISDTISAREEEKRLQQQSGTAFGSSTGSSSNSFSSGGGFLDSLFKKCKIESGSGSGCDQSSLLYKGKQ